ncbi:MAG: hypothetical protein OSB09_08765 [Planctomycetota bacterium]|nr:hypothetical protein [Planctomycetota bacterium]
MARKRGGRGSSSRTDMLDEALVSLDRSRGPLFLEKQEQNSNTPGRPDGHRDPNCCRRPQNRMRISDLEAIDISRAFSEKPHLKGKLNKVLAKMGQSLTFIGDTNKAQPYTCPLLDGETCLVHRSAKPIECLAIRDDESFSSEGKRSIVRRDQLNKDLFADKWDYKSIPLMLATYLLDAEGPALGKSGSTLRKEQQKKKRRESTGRLDTEDRSK